MIISQSPELDQLATALAKAQGAIRGAVKDSTNPAFRSSYANLASVWEACRDQLSANGLAVSQHVGRLEDGSASVTTLLLHASGQHIASMVSATPKDQSSAAVGSVLTYLRRYALSAAVGIAPIEDDDDGQAAGTPPARAQGMRPPEPSPALQRTAQRVVEAFPGASVEGIERTPVPASSAAPSCPKCGGAMWDNRGKKAEGKLNPKAPDWGCKDRAKCDGAVWGSGKPKAQKVEENEPPPDGFPF